MSNAFSSYVALIDNVEHIPLAARESPTLSPDERALLIARVLDFARDGVVPQAEREDAGIEELFYTGLATVVANDRTAWPGPNHDPIVERADELARVDPAADTGQGEYLDRTRELSATQVCC